MGTADENAGEADAEADVLAQAKRSRKEFRSWLLVGTSIGHEHAIETFSALIPQWIN